MTQADQAVSSYTFLMRQILFWPLEDTFPSAFALHPCSSAESSPWFKGWWAFLPVMTSVSLQLHRFCTSDFLEFDNFPTFWLYTSSVSTGHCILSESGIFLKALRACLLSRFSHVWLFATLWTIACQAPLSMGFSRQEYWSWLPCPPPGDLSDPEIEPPSLMLPSLAGGFFTTSSNWEALMITNNICLLKFYSNLSIVLCTPLFMCLTQIWSL